MQLALFFKGAGEKCDEDPRRRIVGAKKSYKKHI
jgi:hypothetical protein